MNHQAEPHRVLIVDDAPTVREALYWAFEHLTDLAIIGEAEDGLTAIEQVKNLTPDIVILDVSLPQLDGFSVARSVKTLPQPPLVIFLTVHSDAVAREEAFEAGGDGFVEKGAGWSALIDQIREVLQKHLHS